MGLFLEKAYNFIEKNRFSGTVIALIAFIIVAFFSTSGVYERFNLNLYDINFEIKPSVDEWDRLVFVDIDENSIATLGKYPWPRNKYADALRVLRDAGTFSATLDIMFPEKSSLHIDRGPYKSIIQSRKETISVDKLSSLVIDNDAIFTRGVRDSGMTIIAYSFTREPIDDETRALRNTPAFQNARDRFYARSSIPVPAEKKERYKSLIPPNSRTLSFPISNLMNTAHAFGFVNRDTDIDGAVRKVRLVAYHDERMFFNLALVMLMDVCGIPFDPARIEVIPGKRIILKKAVHPETFEVTDIKIPIDKDGMMYVNWAGPGAREKSFSTLPFYALLEYRIHANDVENHFDEVEMQRGAIHESPLNKLYTALDETITGFREAAAPETRRARWKEIKKLRKDIIRQKVTYRKEVDARLAKLEEEYKKNKNPETLKRIAEHKNFIKKINLVLQVQSLVDKLTLTGLTAVGTIDIGQIPIHKEYPMVGVYHNTVNTIIQEDFINEVPHWVNLILMLIIALMMGYYIQNSDARRSLVMIGVLFFVINAIIMVMFLFLNIWFEQFGINLAFLLPSLTIAGIKFVNEEKQKRYIKSAFSRYLTPGVIDEIIENPEALELGGENRNITIFFSDVAGFSSISEKLTPPQLVALLNEYLSEMTDIILDHGGTIDKYEGDAIMAFYGAPKEMPDHGLKACLAAIEMKKRLRELQDQWKARGADVLTARMGMNSGNAVVGNMGSRMRMDYTAMGDSVNLASRLEGANKFYNTKAMLSEDTYKMAKDEIEARKLDRIRVVGKTEPVVIYELLSRKGALPQNMQDMLEQYYLGLEQFEQREWRKARNYFRAGLKIIEDDGPCQTYYDRCSEYIKKEPPKKWDGVYTLKSK